MATRGPLLRQMAVQQHLWGEVAAAVQVGSKAALWSLRLSSCYRCRCCLCGWLPLAADS
jgi:hypothetical protein